MSSGKVSFSFPIFSTSNYPTNFVVICRGFVLSENVNSFLLMLAHASHRKQVRWQEERDYHTQQDSQSDMEREFLVI